MTIVHFLGINLTASIIGAIIIERLISLEIMTSLYEFVLVFITVVFIQMALLILADRYFLCR